MVEAGAAGRATGIREDGVAEEDEEEEEEEEEEEGEVGDTVGSDDAKNRQSLQNKPRASMCGPSID